MSESNKPSGCIELNGKYVDVKKLCDYIVSGDLSDVKLYTSNRGFYSFSPNYERIYVVYMLDDGASYGGASFGHRVGTYSNIKNVVKAVIENVRANNDKFVNIPDIIWDAKPVSADIHTSTPVTTTQNRISQTEKCLNSINPTGSLYVDYDPAPRATLPVGPCLITYDKTAGLAPNTPVTIYRGVSKEFRQRQIVPGDFITTNRQLANDYAGGSHGYVLQKTVRACDILDDKADPLGEEYLYRPQSTQRFVSQQSFMAIGRLINSRREMVGLVLSDGKQQFRTPKAKCIELANKGEIKNAKAVSRTGVKPYLQGKGISLESLPVITVQ